MGRTREWVRTAATATEVPEGTPAIVPQPEKTPEAMRAAVAAIDAGALEVFEADLAETIAAGEEHGIPLLMESWWMWCAVERLPELAARLRNCHARCPSARDSATVRAISAEIGQILRDADAASTMGL